jgi:aspartyl/asparaginyl beta-hydroxylase (cupin superfamily)
MTLTANQMQTLRDEARAALSRRDGKAAVAALEQLPDAPPLTLAQAYLMAGNREAGEAAIDRLLESEPRHIWGLIIKGDCRMQAGDSRGANAFFRAALDAGAKVSQPGADLRTALGRVQERLAGMAARFEEDLRGCVEGTGDAPSTRIAEALDILTGRKQIYMQQPQSFYFPGLPQIQFYEREDFAWIPEMEARTEALREELLGVLDVTDGGFRPYVESEPGRPAKLNAMVGDARWSAYYLWENGALVPEHAERCPQALAALELAPIPVIERRSPMALFSRMEPGMHILPHSGFFNTRLICHLPLIAPPGCELRVGNETRTWRQGEMLVFDDSIEHEAWNRADSTRVVLLFEIWRPEIREAEREMLTRMFTYIAAYSS